MVMVLHNSGISRFGSLPSNFALVWSSSCELPLLCAWHPSFTHINDFGLWFVVPLRSWVWFSNLTPWCLRIPRYKKLCMKSHFWNHFLLNWSVIKLLLLRVLFHPVRITSPPYKVPLVSSFESKSLFTSPPDFTGDLLGNWSLTEGSWAYQGVPYHIPLSCLKHDAGSSIPVSTSLCSTKLGVPLNCAGGSSVMFYQCGLHHRVPLSYQFSSPSLHHYTRLILGFRYTVLVVILLWFIIVVSIIVFPSATSSAVSDWRLHYAAKCLMDTSPCHAYMFYVLIQSVVGTWKFCHFVDGVEVPLSAWLLSSWASRLPLPQWMLTNLASAAPTSSKLKVRCCFCFSKLALVTSNGWLLRVVALPTQHSLSCSGSASPCHGKQ